MDSPESWRTYQSRGVLLVFIFGFSMLSYGSIPVIESINIVDFVDDK